jgi:hypothetical protein
VGADQNVPKAVHLQQVAVVGVEPQATDGEQRVVGEAADLLGVAAGKWKRSIDQSNFAKMSRKPTRWR